MNLYLLPFINTFLLYICIEPKLIFNKPYEWMKNHLFVYLPQQVISILGGCVLCTSMWMGIIEVLIYGFGFQFNWNLIVILFYNAITTSILYRLL